MILKEGILNFHTLFTESKKTLSIAILRCREVGMVSEIYGKSEFEATTGLGKLKIGPVAIFEIFIFRPEWGREPKKSPKTVKNDRNRPGSGRKVKISKIAARNLEIPFFSPTGPIFSFPSAPIVSNLAFLRFSQKTHFKLEFSIQTLIFPKIQMKFT